MILRLTRVCKSKRGARERNFQSWLDRRTFPPRNARSTTGGISVVDRRGFRAKFRGGGGGWLKSESFSSRARGGRRKRDENSGDCCVPVHRTSKNVCKVSFSSASIANLTDKRSCEHAKLVRQRGGLSSRKKLSSRILVSPAILNGRAIDRPRFVSRNVWKERRERIDGILN